jgi:class 3 adenylate cyclase
MMHLKIQLLFCSFVLGLNPLTMQGQSGYDSKTTPLPNLKSEISRVNLLYDTAWELIYKDDRTAEKMLWEALWLSQKVNFLKGAANSWNGLGALWDGRSRPDIALGCYQKCLQIRLQNEDKTGIAKALYNIGKTYNELGHTEEALKNLKKCLYTYEQLKDSAGIARAHESLGSVYSSRGLYNEAQINLDHYREYVVQHEDPQTQILVLLKLGHIRYELEMFEEARKLYLQAHQISTREKDSLYLADASLDLGNALSELKKPKEALAYYQQALDILSTLERNEEKSAVYNSMAIAYKHLNLYETGIHFARKSIDIRQQLQDKPGIMEAQNSLGDLQFENGNYPLALEYVNKYFQTALELDDKKYILKGYKDLAKIFAKMGDYRKAFFAQRQFSQLRDSLFTRKREEDFARREALFSDNRKQEALERNEQSLKLKDAELQKSGAKALTLLISIGALLLIAGLLFKSNHNRKRTNKELSSKNALIEKEKERADNLLRNILPAKTALELLTNNSVKPVRYEHVTVLFSDFKGFTQVAEQLSPEQLIIELDSCFRMFDEITSRFNIEKIKTIGDAYMCASGLPEPRATHAQDMVMAALEMMHGIQAFTYEKKKRGEPYFEMRIGIHTGPLVAGVVGSHKFAYDIWGDTVNIAARMEQSGEPNNINISQTTYDLVKHQFLCIPRGRVAAKNKGEIEMYFVRQKLAV